MRKKTLTNKRGLVLNVGDDITVAGRPGTIKGFNHRGMIEVELMAFPGSSIHVDADFKIEKMKSHDSEGSTND